MIVVTNKCLADTIHLMFKVIAYFHDPNIYHKNQLRVTLVKTGISCRQTASIPLDYL